MDQADFHPGQSIPLPDMQATAELGARIAAGLRDRSVIALCGGLGAGKTHLVKAIAAGLGSPAEVTSPTFTLVHEYPGGRLPVWHFDFYRAESAGEIPALGWDEYLDSGVCAVEWADRFPGLLPPHTQWWKLELEGDGARRATLLAEPPDD